MKEYLRVLPGCCQESTNRKVPYLEYPHQKDDGTFLKDRKPVWCVLAIGTFGEKEGFFSTYQYESSMEVKFCPFCGTGLPEIELNQKSKRKKIYNTDSGDYCESCKERSICCNCLPAPFRWKPVGVELELPKLKKKEEEY